MNSRQKAIVVVFSMLLSLTARVLSDALHIPGYYDSLGVITSTALLPLPWSILTSVVTSLALTGYYKVYLFLPWLFALISILYWLFSVKLGGRFSLLAFIVIPPIYALSWFVFYGIMTNNLSYMPLFLRMRGFYILMFDSAVCIALGGAIAGGLKGLDFKKVAALCAILLVVFGGSFYAVNVREASVGGNFPNFSWLKRFPAHKMDFVWLPLGEKGRNTYYYPLDRFERGSPGYQVWIGMYWVEGYHNPEDVGLVAKFAVWDQNVWLGTHGCKEPYTYVDLVQNITQVNYKGYRAYLMYGGMVSRSDVPPYEEVKLRGFFLTFYDSKRDMTGIIYVCSTDQNLKVMVKKFWEVVNSWNP